MKNRKLFVLDTNVLLHDPLYYQSFQEHDIAIPVEVLEEIDKFKKGDGSINVNARDFIRFIDKLPPAQLFDGGASRGKGLGKIRIVITPPYHDDVKKIFPESSIDNLILNTAYCLSKGLENKDRQVIFVSKDVNLRMKAKALKISAEDYKANAVADVAPLYEQAKIIKVKKGLINEELYKDDGASYPEGEIKLNENEFVILQETKERTALAVHKEKRLYPIKRDKVSSFGISPRNSEQAFALSALLDPKISLVTIIGKAGTGKTLMSLAAGLKLLEENKIEKIFFTRQTIALGNNDIGFLPGDVREKMSPYMQGLYDNLDVLRFIPKELGRNKNPEKIRKYTEDGKIVIEPLLGLRGRSLPKIFFIIDEAQNLTPGEVKAIVTRAGEDAKIIMIGDISQIDLPSLDEKSNGLSYLISKMRGQKVHAHITLIKGERSPLAELAGDLL